MRARREKDSQVWKQVFNSHIEVSCVSFQAIRLNSVLSATAPLPISLVVIVSSFDNQTKKKAREHHHKARRRLDHLVMWLVPLLTIVVNL